MQENKPILIVGLGNPGTKYAMTRHNVGFMAIDHLAGVAASWKSEKNALITKIALHTPHSTLHTLLAKPQTFMNNSGIAVRDLMTFYKIPLENLIVIHDEMDLKVGTMREKTGGGSAGHNGIKSIDANVGKEYLRIRIGVGHPRDSVQSAECKVQSIIDPADWVLGKFSADELIEINRVISDLKIID